MKLLNKFRQHQLIAVLIDPEKCRNPNELVSLIRKINISDVDFIFIGGSTVSKQEFDSCIQIVKSNTTIDIIIFPGSSDQISNLADGILYLSLLSGRNPDFLIGHHVQSATEIYESKIEVLPTSYLLIDGGTQSSVAYVSQTTPIPQSNISIAKKTALAGKLQGKQLTFLDAGSGAKYPVPTEMIQSVAELGQPLIIGGGITSIEKIEQLHKAGANCVVIGNKIEDDIDFLLELKHYNSKKALTKL